MDQPFLICPFCKTKLKTFHISEAYGEDQSKSFDHYYCDNCPNEYIPFEFHYFTNYISYLAFSLNDKSVFIYYKENKTKIEWDNGYEIFNFTLIPDFSDFNKLNNKINTILNFK